MTQHKKTSAGLARPHNSTPAVFDKTAEAVVIREIQLAFDNLMRKICYRLILTPEERAEQDMIRRAFRSLHERTK
jgi:hypothetical protein